MSVLERAGIDTTDPSFKDIASITTQIPSVGEEALNSLMNANEAISWAKNNAEIKKHFVAQAFNGFDKTIAMTAENSGLDESQIAQLNAEKNTGKKQEMLISFLNEKIESAKSGQKGAKTEEIEAKYKAEIEKLNATVNQTKTDYESKLAEKDSHHHSYVLNSKMDSVLNSQKWSENYPADMRGTLGRLAVEKELQKLGAKPVLDADGNIKFVKSDSPDLEYFDTSNKKITFEQIAARTLAENKFLAASTQTPNTHTPIPAANPSQPKTPPMTKPTHDALSQAMKDQGII